MRKPDRPAATRRLLGRLRGERPVRYRHGIPNRADELLAAHPHAEEWLTSGVLEMGDYSYATPLVQRFPGDRTKARIGRFTSIAPGVQLFLGGAHPTDWVTTYPIRAGFFLPGAFEDGNPTSRGDITIGNDCWLASEAVILSGVSVGDGAVVAARAVVSSDVRPYAVVAGNPAREVRRRFRDDQVDALLRIAWWDWPVEEVLAHVDLLCSPDVDALIARFDHG
jgi:acetyltransferase-like isoleucine patch superfamily enzyme